MLYFARGSRTDVITPDEVREALFSVFKGMGRRRRVLAIPPDFTRINSFAGRITEMANDYYGDALTDVLPALGTHSPMTAGQIKAMFGSVPAGKFRVHDWRNGVKTIGTVPGEYVSKVSEGMLDFPLEVQVNGLLLDPSFDLILSIGQVVPHEVIGMSNYNKNIFVGVGGSDFINKSHFLGACYGMERIMGRAESPVRSVFGYADTNFAAHLPIVYVLTVRDRQDGEMVTRGLFIGDGPECFHKAAALSLETNFTMVDRQIRKCVVYLDPEEFKSTWLGNKAVYRTRMAIADGGELIILAPGLREFGEDAAIDALIRRYGYRGTRQILDCTAADKALQENLSAPAHLIHGSSEGRFAITCCPCGGLTREEIEGVGYGYCSYDRMAAKYSPDRLRDGWNVVDGEEIYYISNPVLGLWAHPDRFR
ncbi:MAG: lactate racemase domain-containing protein [Bacteroidales bacterium]|nr:lactate racemase domain-containing protein [Bacteroidales bacterium]